MTSTTKNSEWIKYEPEGSGYVFPKDWGKDHWSIFAYAVSCIVGKEGVLDNSKMRTNTRIHREMVYISPFGTTSDGSVYPTILKFGKIEKHDDWSCLEDMVAAGLLNIFFTKISHEAFGCCKAKAELTDKGWGVARKLIEHKNAGGNFANFEL